MSRYPEITERAQHLLKVLVERYIDDGQPVGSRALSRDAGLNLSPATIRNVMSDLEELGLIASPHTSAGRMPTVSGYRFFVDSLLTVRPLQHEIVTQCERGLIEDTEDPEELLESASRMLADMTRMAGLVSVPRRDKTVFRMIEFIPLSENRILVILVTNDQEVQNKVIYPSRRFSASELTTVQNYLNQTYAGQALAEVRHHVMSEVQEAQDRMTQELADGAEIAGLAFKGQKRKKRHPFVMSGETNLMDFDELASTEHLRILLSAFQQKEDMVHLLDRCLETPGVKIFIGEESGYQPLQQCSLVTASYVVDEHTVGLLGVIGPTRMDYERVIPLVDLTSKLLGSVLNQRNMAPL